MQGRVVRSSVTLAWEELVIILFSLTIFTSMLDHGNPPVNKPVKGLLKGFKYISQIFEGEKEQEMVIGLPTDVKHVAHIGWDGPTTLTSPSWMNEFHSAPLSTAFDPTAKQSGSPKSVSQEIPLGGVPPSPSRDEEPSPKPRRTRRPASSESPVSPTRESRESSSRGSRHSRKHHSTGSAPGSDPPTGEASESSSSRRGRRHHKSSDSAAVGAESESPARDLPSIPKQSRKEKEGKKEGKKEKDEKKEGKKERKSKASDSGSTRSKHKNPSSSVLSGSDERTARPVTPEEAA